MQSPRVLAIDNDPDALIGLEHALETAGIPTTTTWHVAEAVRLLQNNCFEVVLVRRHAQMEATAICEYCRHKPWCAILAVDNLFDHENILHLIRGSEMRDDSPLSQPSRAQAANS